MSKRRVVVALLSTGIYSLILATLLYTPIASREPNTSYSSFASPLPFLLLMTGAAYFLGGIPISSFIDKSVNKKIMKLLYYFFAGFIVGCLTIMIAFKTISLEVLSFGLYGAIGGFIFFILMSLDKVLQNTPMKN